jgi:hypothetical protein
MTTTKIFKGYQAGKLNETLTYKCFFTSTDNKGFTSTEVKYLSVEEFKKLPKVGEEVKVNG